jgi:hypothetical protein
MAEKPDPTAAADPAEDQQPVEEPQAEGGEGGITPGMSHEALVGAGVSIDLPYEAPPGKPEPLTYADDLGDEKGWTAPEGFTIAGVAYDEVVAGIGGGVEPQPQTPGTPAPEGDDGSGPT